MKLKTEEHNRYSRGVVGLWLVKAIILTQRVPTGSSVRFIQETQGFQVFLFPDYLQQRIWSLTILQLHLAWYLLVSSHYCLTCRVDRNLAEGVRNSRK